MPRRLHAVEPLHSEQANRLRAFRDRLGVGQAQLAHQVLGSFATVKRWEAGRHRRSAAGLTAAHKGSPKMRTRRPLIALAAGVLCVVPLMSGAASAHAKGIKGEPQPELKPFKIGSSETAGNVAILANGDLVVAYGVATKNHQGAARVCVLARGGHSCTSDVKLAPVGTNDIFDVTQVFALSSDTVVVLQAACCDADPNGDVLYTSTDGGHAFGPGVKVSAIDVNAAVRIGGNIVFVGASPTFGTEIESIPDNASSPSAGPATVEATEPTTEALGTYQSGLLVADDILGSDDTTKVQYAPSGMDFNSPSSYSSVASFPHEELLGMSGKALLTIQTKGKNHILLRFFNGSSFGSAHTVPGYKGSTLGLWATIDRDSSGVTHLFFESEFVAPIYHLLEVSTTKGTHWTHPTDLGNAIKDTTFNAGLDANGSGLVFGVGAGGSTDARGYPVLAPQSVSFSLSKSSIKKGHKVTGKGKVSKAAKGRKVWLQVERKGRWYNVASTKESSSGAFSFTIKGSAVGTFKYRAMADDHAGYVMFGYSSGHSLKVKS